MKVYNSILELVGNTPLVKLNRLEKALGLKANLYAKVESFNPAGSIKDRVAKNIIETAEKSGALKKGATVIEPTSGNTGIGLALVCLLKGYKVILTMPENMSAERQKLLRAYGAEIVLTDKALGMQGAIDKANELAKTIDNSFIAGQFENPANPETHYKTTAVEIFDGLDGQVDCLVAGVGTGGTLTGIGKYLKEKNNGVSVVAIEPSSSAVLSGEKKGPHGLQGIGAGFIPKTLDTSVYNSVIKVTEEQAYKYANLLAKTEGILVGISSGAALYGAIEVVKSGEFDGKNVVVILPDGGEKYLSTNLYE
ncbi:MAG: cysteine synthase A [Clostridia bacterium]|nr:cysteine synthase A [Clostridia bacterium]